jgi:class 3 adenylate cyclase
LRGAGRARLVGHAAGLASYEALALAGAAGDLAWLAGLQLALALALLEAAWGLADARGRSLKRLAVEVYTGSDIKRRQADGLKGFLDGLGARALRRSLFVWLAGGIVLKSCCGLSWMGLILLASFGALQAALAAAGLSGAAARAALADGLGAEGAWPPDLDSFKRWPSLRRRFLTALAAPLAAVLLPLAALAALGLPVDGTVLGILAGLGALTAAAWGRDLEGQFKPSLSGLSEALGRLAAGDFSQRPAPSGADTLGRSVLDAGKAAAALERRERSLRAFGAGLDPARGVGLVDGLGAPPQEPVVAVLAARWLGADASLAGLEPSARLAALGRFYESVLDAVQRCGGTVLELGGGQVLAAWGAPEPQGAGLAGIEGLNSALKAAWMLRSSLAVARSQHSLRHAGVLDFSLALASGQAAAGAWGPGRQRRWALVGHPLAEVRRLARKPGGPWLDDSSAALTAAPYGVRGGAGNAQLVAGPE